MNLFIMDDNDNVVVNKIEVLLVPEFAALWEPVYNRASYDRNGYNRIKANRAFKYIYLYMDWESPFKNAPEQERKNDAIEASKLTEEELNDPKLIAALKRYEKMQVTPQARLLKSTYRLLDEMALYNELLDLQERKEDGTYVTNAKQAGDGMSNLPKILSSLESLELVVKRQKDANTKQVRGDVELGTFD
jgi:hypothetical protein